MDTKDTPWEPLGQGKVTDRIAQQILLLIAREQLRPGDRLPAERELATVLEVSRPSLREAVRSLQAQGHLEVRHGSGVFVAEPHTVRELRAAVLQQQLSLDELFAMREVLELPAAVWAAERRDADKLDAVRGAYEALVAAAEEPDIDLQRLRALDTAFHLSIVDAAGNRFLEQTAGVLHDMLAAGMRTTMWVPGRLETSQREHERILVALLAGDAAAARRAARRHIRAAHIAGLSRIEAT
ncbi:MAG: FCD domain-containing protein [Streptosporangiales bacterium]|nr:FCD domain-containing protein [Streptosporangiales bacterium]